MRRAACRSGHMLKVLGAVALSASSAGGESVSDRPLHFACLSSTHVDPSRLAAVCAGFLDTLGAQPGYRVQGTQDTPLSTGPGLEIDVIRATESQLELLPTWVDASGVRTAMPSTGLVIADAAMTEPMRRRLYLGVLDQLPK
ncbi:hypothetical protein [Rhodobacter calidifons]|uniref:ABC transporter substrate-binding protein n=1 Tax=Rhodobacter calidifons TaxID=2715277 RepID=A0ABX0G4U7_9RHOB|nr:hypothetical protein [Rhodobacter calidifons]NHB76247.1 hypothetical protein [Rhodobacter calidifons]